MRNVRWMALMVLALFAAATRAHDIPNNAEASMLVTGTIVVAADGSVISHAIDHPEKLDAGVVEMIDGSMTEWRFKPMHDKASATMRLVVHAKKHDSGKYRISIGSANFESPQDPAGWVFGKRSLPEYPHDALGAGVSGVVYLSIHVDRDGKVIDVMTEQVNLNVEDKPKAMDHWRDLLSAAAIYAAKTWQFRSAPGSITTPATDSETARTLRVPVQFLLEGDRTPAYGQWSVYVPGPQHAIPWLTHDDAGSTSPEALAADGIYPVEHSGLHLVTQFATN